MRAEQSHLIRLLDADPELVRGLDARTGEAARRRVRTATETCHTPSRKAPNWKSSDPTASVGSTAGFRTDRMRVEWSLDIGAPSPRLSSTEIVHDQDLARLLDDIERDAPERVIAEIVAPDGARLGIGLGGTRSVLV